jgi:hypothetical protein
MDKPQDPEAAETVQTTSAPAVDLPRLVRLSRYQKMPNDGCGEWIGAPNNGGDVGDMLDIVGELNGLLVALHDAINRPKGVVPKSAERFYQANVKEHATLSAGARADHGVDVEVRKRHENRAADRVCVSRLVRRAFGCLVNLLASKRVRP